MKETDEILKDLIAKENELAVKVDQLKEAENQLVKVKAAIKALSPDLKFVARINLGFAAGENYNPKGTWKDKIKYAIKSKGHAGIKTIAEFICTMEPELNPKKVYGSVAVNVGDMVNKQKSLKAKTVNGKNEYSLNE